MLGLVIKDIYNYLATGKLMAAHQAESKGCTFDFSEMELDSVDAFNEDVGKVTEDLKGLDVLPRKAKNFNNFPPKILIPKIPEALRVPDRRPNLCHA